jgi:hypothetical protein
MANRFWVGGTGTWTPSGTTNWSATSGGAGGASAPVVGDIARFDSNSGTGTVTISGSLTLDQLEITSGANITFAGSGTRSFLFGFNANAGVVFNNTGAWSLGIGAASGGLWSISCLSTVTFPLILNRSGTGGSIFNLPGESFVSTSTITLTNGVLAVRSSTNFTAASIIATTANTRKLQVGNADANITLTGSEPLNISGSGFTTEVVGGSPSVGADLTFSSQTITANFNDVSFADFKLNITATGIKNITLNDAVQFRDLLIENASYTGVSRIRLNRNLTVSNSIIMNGTLLTRRVAFISKTTVTLTSAALTSSRAVDFVNVTPAGAMVPFSVFEASLMGGVGITNVPAPKTVYWNLAGSQNLSATGWATTSGGTPNADNFPRMQDTIVFDEAGSAGTVTLNSHWNLGHIDASARTTAMTLALGSENATVSGDIELGSGVTVTGSSSASDPLTFTGILDSTINIDFADKTIPRDLLFRGSGKSFELGSDLIVTATGGVVLEIGEFDANGFDVTTTRFSVATQYLSTTRTLTMGAGAWVLNGSGTVWGLSTPQGLTLNAADISVVNNSASAVTFAAGGLDYAEVEFTGSSGAGGFTVTGTGNTFDRLSDTKTTSHNLLFQNNSTQNIGEFDVSGSVSHEITLGQVSTGIFTMNLTGPGTVMSDYLNISNSTVTPVATWFAGNNSNDNGNNVGWIFSDSLTSSNFFMFF